MRQFPHKTRGAWKAFRRSAHFHNALVFLGFVVIATVFWFIMALNDSVQDSFDVRLKIDNVPDSVTFINDPPQKIHVSVRDKGTALLRRAVLNDPTLHVNFNEFASQGIFRFSAPDLSAALREYFGPSASVTSLSVDSLRLAYTLAPGKRVPIVIAADVTASSGNIISGKPVPSHRNALVYADRNILDTITRVFTQKIVRRNLSETTTADVRICPVAGAKIEPSVISVTIPVEPLVNKHSMQTVTVVGAPEGISILLFPSKVDVSYYVPMSKFGENQSGINIVADYNDIRPSGKVPVKIGSHPSDCINVTLHADSIEYTVVK